MGLNLNLDTLCPTSSPLPLPGMIFIPGREAMPNFYYKPQTLPILCSTQ